MDRKRERKRGRKIEKEKRELTLKEILVWL